MVGSLSSTTTAAKPLLLDCFFPFDPYLLDESKIYIEDIYRPYTGEIIEDLSQDDEDDDSEDSEDDNNETPDSGLGRRRKRTDSFRFRQTFFKFICHRKLQILNLVSDLDRLPAAPRAGRDMIQLVS